ncbi:CoA transferase [Roseovarius nubinhibens]|uniref:CoA transferase n=1 Tax=Roseovarius nubinhibens TaxID=314263 RepID=A0A348WH82_9RHOB|nr:CoA transferase [Roseovarius nubinhibens]MBU2999755.1 CoA transferase [Roseovarius nubinhibens]HAR53894.1 CoA transferase [Roseovarius nubinhibens]|tara:strand:+ start:12204 stop:13376 length:1173 start_codon:yes stop_codon:yes gene_type:complete
MSFERPYEGLKVVDLSQGLAGPYCGMLMAQQGADVIKIEPQGGDWARLIGGVYGDHTAYSIVANCGKRAMAMNLKAAPSREITDKLIAEADVFIEGYRPGVAERLGYGYEALSAVNPGLIYISVSGFGQCGPMRDRPAMDPMLQAFSGFVAENTGTDGIPHHTPVSYFDMSTGLYAQQALAGALYARKDGAPGRKIEVSLLEAAASIQAVRLLSGYRTGPRRSSTAPSGTFKTRDGHIQINIVRDREFETFCTLLALDDLWATEKYRTIAGRLEDIDFLNDYVRRVTENWTAEDLSNLLSEAGLQNEVVQTYRDLVRHPQAEAVGVFSWLQQAGANDPWPVPNIPGMPAFEPGSALAQSPTVGEHTRQILEELGYGADEIDGFYADGVVA